ncbi:MAG: PmoA family protein [Opitutae bacterium]|nr:PmoA family protein [Opitutae bacterium]MBT5692084.1 PmoA family protein [Opitutae bacterium]MBT6958373.1 PmoA family protein [Opitutae bacterium]
MKQPLLLLLFATTLPPIQAEKVSLQKGKGKVIVNIEGKLFTEYLYDGHGRSKPVLYPILGPGGARMTRDYPFKKGTPGEASDHPHHASLWFTHGEVNGISFWHVGKNTGVIKHQKFIKVDGNTISTTNKWLSAKGEEQCSDDTSISFHALGENRAIDFDITVHASSGDVKFGDTKEGSMGIRTNPALRVKGSVAKGQAINSEGIKGKAVWGKRAKWVDYWGPINGNTVGIAIFDHPGNQRHPTWWHARDYGLVAANPFGVHNFEGKPKGTGDLVIKSGEKVRFRYRFLFHAGDVKAAKISENYTTWAK